MAQEQHQERWNPVVNAGSPSTTIHHWPYIITPCNRSPVWTRPLPSQPSQLPWDWRHNRSDTVQRRKDTTGTLAGSTVSPTASTGTNAPINCMPIRARVGLIGDLKFWFSQYSDPRGCTRRSIPPTIGWSCLEILVHMNNKTGCNVMHSVYQVFKCPTPRAQLVIQIRSNPH